MLPFHPYADLFPLIEGEAFAELVADVKANDVREKIVVWDGAILDGRNRYRAALAAGLIDDDDGPDRAKYFTRFVPAVDGDPLHFVISKNLHRRHLDDTQRASVAGKIANLSRGGDRSKPPIGGLTVGSAATSLNVAPRQAERARVVHHDGVPELRRALDRGDIAVSAAEKIARMPEADQHREVERVLPTGNRSIMASRQQAPGDADYFPTPPWATRALIEIVLRHLKVDVHKLVSAWEPACGEGHMAEVLREYVRTVHASDKFEYGYGETFDYLNDDGKLLKGTSGVDWIITNPPFEDNALSFVTRALSQAKRGVAMFFRSQWAVEGIERYETLFRDQPPSLTAFFVERVNLCEGRWDPDGSTATAYCWLVWDKLAKPQPTFWIPPGCRKLLVRDDDRERFTAKPVAKRSRGGLPFIIPDAVSKIPPDEVVEKIDTPNRENAPTPASPAPVPDPAYSCIDAEPIDPNDPDGTGIPVFLRKSVASPVPRVESITLDQRGGGG